MQGISSLAEDLSASQEMLCSMELQKQMIIALYCSLPLDEYYVLQRLESVHRGWHVCLFNVHTSIHTTQMPTCFCQSCLSDTPKFTTVLF